VSPQAFEYHIRRFIISHHLLKENDHVLVALSGGMDSMVLLHLLHRLNYDISAAHCNFMLRGKESDDDEAFCEEVCAGLNIPIYTRKFDTAAFAASKKISVQMAARDLRYDWFAQLQEAHGYTAVVTGHHTGDLAETILLNLISGRGMEGSGGIPLRRGTVVRPLLYQSRKELEQYATKRGIGWRTDSSNLTTDYQRNLLRLQVLPLLETINPSVEKTLLQFSERWQALQHLADAEMEDLLAPGPEEINGVSCLHTQLIAGHPSAMLLFQKALAPYGFNSAVIRHLTVSGKQPGLRVYSPTHRITCGRDCLYIEAVNTQPEEEPILIGEADSAVHFSGRSYLISRKSGSFDSLEFGHHENSTLVLDAGLLRYPLEIRHWKPGDFFHPLGMEHRQKISDYLINRKIPLHEKEKVSVLVSGQTIVGIPGERPDHHYRVTENTRELFFMEYSRH